MSFAVIRRIIDEDDAPAASSEVTVDLKVSSAAELEKSIATLQQELLARKEGLDVALVGLQFRHIEAELATDVIPFSIEHLELYQQYLIRFVPEALPADVRPIQERLLLSVQAKLKSHPLIGDERSGDKQGNEDDFTYFKIPARRRRQMMVMLYANLLTGPPLVLFMLFIFWRIVPFSTYMFLLYATWVLYDNKKRPMPAPKRVIQKWRQTGFYTLFRDYFPIRTVRASLPEKEGKDAKGKKAKGGAFDPTGHYLFCYHPHGVQSAGAFQFATAASGFDGLFPGLQCSLQTLNMNFAFPVTREMLIALGAGNASKECLLKALSDEPGSSAMLVTGGAKESMFAHPGNSKVVLKDRMGFVKVAIAAGASLTPVWGFGENNLYENLAVKSKSVRSFQRRLQKVISFAPLMMEGRGVFSYSGGLIPHRRPITVVVGDPIPTGKPDPNPSNERIAEVHGQYLDAVATLFNNYKDIYDPKAEPLVFC